MLLIRVFQAWSEVKWISVIIAIINGTRHFEPQNRQLENVGEQHIWKGSNTSGFET